RACPQLYVKNNCHPARPRLPRISRRQSRAAAASDSTGRIKRNGKRVSVLVKESCQPVPVVADILAAISRCFSKFAGLYYVACRGCVRVLSGEGIFDVPTNGFYAR